MKNQIRFLAVLSVTAAIATTLVFRATAADAKDPIKEAMKAYHKAPKGTDPTCKKAMDGKPTPEELKQLLAAYKSMTTAKPPQGDDASWKDKTAKLYAAAQALEKGEAGAAAKYKDAVNCKACHSVHKPQ